MLDNEHDNSRWEQCLELLTHLCQYSDNILLVTGPQGSGKTSMRRALMRDVAEEFFFCSVQATENLSAEDLTQQIETGVFDAVDKDLLLLIDDAENLSLEAIAVLLQVKQKIVVLNTLRIVLFASDALQQKVAKAVFKTDFIKNVHAIEISTMKTELTTNNSKLSPFTIGLTICFGVLFCALAFLWPDAEEKALDNVTPQELIAQALPPAQKTLLESNVPTPPEPMADNTITVATMEQVPADTTPAVTINTEIMQANDTTVVDANTTTVEINHGEQIAQLEQKLLVVQQQLQQEQQARKAIEAKYKKLANNPNPTAVKKNVTKKPLFISKRENRILALPSKNYTLQLLCVNSESKAQNFINNHGLQATANYYKSNIKGKDWYIVIYGNFNSKTAAQIALAKLPLSLKKLHPWLREYTNIQAAIKKRAYHE